MLDSIRKWLILILSKLIKRKDYIFIGIILRLPKEEMDVVVDVFIFLNYWSSLIEVWSACCCIFIKCIIHEEKNNSEVPDKNENIINSYSNILGSLLNPPHQQHSFNNNNIDEQQPSKNSMIDSILQKRYTQQSCNTIQWQSPAHIMNRLHSDIFAEKVGYSNEDIMRL